MAFRHAAIFAGSALSLFLWPASSNAAVTDTTANLTLRSGPSMSHKVNAVTPAGNTIKGGIGGSDGHSSDLA